MMAWTPREKSGQLLVGEKDGMVIGKHRRTKRTYLQLLNTDPGDGQKNFFKKTFF